VIKKGFCFFLIFVLFSCSEQKPNVLFVIVDDLRPLNSAITPNIDLLAQKGIRFTNAYSQYANCSPSRQSIFSGLSPVRGSRGGNLNQYLKDNPQVSMPNHFKQNGYQTASLGKVYHRSKDDRKAWNYFHDIPFEKGFHPWESYGSIKNQQIKDESDRPAIEMVEEPLSKYNDYMISLEAMEMMEKFKGDPFFMVVGFRKPHLPFAAPKQFWDIYQRDQFEPSKYNKAPFKGDSIVYQWSELSSYTPYTNSYKTENYRQNKVTEDQSSELIHGYHACVSYIDFLVGLLLKKLATLDLDKKTIVVFTSDHGFHLGEQQIWGKHSNYKLSTHVPLILYDPKLRTNKKTREGFVELLDLYPTLSELVGLNKPIKVDGKSLIPLIKNPKALNYSNAFSMYQSFQKDISIKDLKAYAVHSTNHTYIEWWDPKIKKIVQQELYELKNGFEEINIFEEKYSENIIQEFSEKINHYNSRFNVQ
jgi:arylsulfatase A-like enzyme